MGQAREKISLVPGAGWVVIYSVMQGHNRLAAQLNGSCLVNGFDPSFSVFEIVGMGLPDANDDVVQTRQMMRDCLDDSIFVLINQSLHNIAVVDQ